MISTRLLAGTPTTAYPHRVYTYMALAMYDATIAAWESKYALQPACVPANWIALCPPLCRCPTARRILPSTRRQPRPRRLSWRIFCRRKLRRFRPWRNKRVGHACLPGFNILAIITLDWTSARRLPSKSWRKPSGWVRCRLDGERADWPAVNGSAPTQETSRPSTGDCCC